MNTVVCRLCWAFVFSSASGSTERTSNKNIPVSVLRLAFCLGLLLMCVRRNGFVHCPRNYSLGSLKVHVSTVFLFQRGLSKTADFSDNDFSLLWQQFCCAELVGNVLSCKEMCVCLWIFCCRSGFHLQPSSSADVKIKKVDTLFQEGIG